MTTDHITEVQNVVNEFRVECRLPEPHKNQWDIVLKGFTTKVEKAHSRMSSLVQRIESHFVTKTESIPKTSVSLFPKFQVEAIEAKWNVMIGINSSRSIVSTSIYKFKITFSKLIVRMEFDSRMLEIVIGDMTTQQVDVIVNAANSSKKYTCYRLIYRIATWRRHCW
jgi:hypothetical protein